MRIVILELLRAGEKPVSELQAALGIDQSSVSRQLADEFGSIQDDVAPELEAKAALREPTLLKPRMV